MFNAEPEQAADSSVCLLFNAEPEQPAATRTNSLTESGRPRTLRLTKAKLQPAQATSGVPLNSDYPRDGVAPKWAGALAMVVVFKCCHQLGKCLLQFGYGACQQFRMIGLFVAEHFLCEQNLSDQYPFFPSLF